jgi:hypothetical protein
MSNYSRKQSLKNTIQVGDLVLPTSRTHEGEAYLIIKIRESIKNDKTVTISHCGKVAECELSGLVEWIDVGRYIHVPVKK